MSNIFGKIFGSEKAIGGVVNGLDAMVFTDEEKAERFSKVLKLYEPFKIAQRLLALIFAIPYALAWFITFVAAVMGRNTDVLVELLSGNMANIIAIIIGFYFAGGMLEGAVKAMGKNVKQ